MQKIILISLFTLFGLILAMMIAGLLTNRLPWFEPPGFSQRLKTYLTTNIAKAHPHALHPELKTELITISASALQQAITQAINDLNWQLADTQNGTFHAIITTPLWRFKDDIYITPILVGENTYSIEVHASSRVGKGDFGANTRHIMNFLMTLKPLIKQH